MFRVFQEEKLITLCMFTCLGISIILRIFLGLLYRNMIKEADNMAITKNRLLRQCKTKFASCYEMSGGVANISVFVDKFLGRMALGHLSFDTLYHLSGQMMLLSVVCSGIGVCKSILTGRTLKKRVLKVNLVDYLENHLSPRIDVTRQDIEMLYGESVFEEKQGSRTPARGRRRKNARGAGRRPEQRTLELMPIGNRLAAGGEELAEMEAPQPPFQQMPPVPPQPEGAAAPDPSAVPDDSALVTEEELEALLKEFLTS